MNTAIIWALNAVLPPDPELSSLVIPPPPRAPAPPPPPPLSVHYETSAQWQPLDASTAGAPVQLPNGVTRVCALPGLRNPNESWGESPHFLDALRGWIRTDGGLYRTLDGARHWKRIFTPAEGSYGGLQSIYSFQFIDSNVGWAIVDGDLLRTTDGGDTWRRCPRLRGDPCLSTLVFSRDGRYGWVAGEVERPLRDGEECANRFGRSSDSGQRTAAFAAVYFTRDGGGTWIQQPVARSMGDISGLFIIDEQHAWATGQAGFFYLKNGRWRVSASEGYDAEMRPIVRGLEIEIGCPTFCPCGVSFPDSSVGWLWNSNGSLAVTQDGGRRWRDILTHDDLWGPDDRIGFFLEVRFVDRHAGWALDSLGDLYATSDGGRNWTQMTTGVEFEDFDISSPDRAWAVTKGELFSLDL